MGRRRLRGTGRRFEDTSTAFCACPSARTTAGLRPPLSMGRSAFGTPTARGSLSCSGATTAATLPRFSPDGRRIVIDSRDNSLRVWDADGSGRARRSPWTHRQHLQRVLQPGRPPHRVQLRRRDGARLERGRLGRAARPSRPLGRGDVGVLQPGRAADRVVLDRQDDPDLEREWPRRIRSCSAGTRTSSTPSLSSFDGRRLFSASEDKTIRVWSDLAPFSGPIRASWRGHELLPVARPPRWAPRRLTTTSHEALRQRCLERVALARATPH